MVGGRETLRAAFVLVSAIASVLVVTGEAMAWPSYADGSNDPVPNASTYKCITCHTGQYGGYPAGGANYRLNAFGMHFGGYTALANHTDGSWDAALQNADSDGDGFTNAQELNNFRLPGFDKSGSSYAFSCYTVPAANYGEPASTFGYYTIGYGGTTLSTPCAGNVGAYNNRAQFDLNDCTLNIDTCDNSPAASCTNIVRPRNEGASFSCTCPSGYMGSGSPAGTICSDIDECMQNPTRCGNGTCQDLTGSFTCNCNTGYVFNGTTCQVSNACLANTDNCGNAPATCTAGAGNTYTCGCQSGYTGSYVNGLIWTCADNNECASVLNCASNRACVNTPGSFTCTTCGVNTQVTGASTNESCACQSGFEGDPLEGCDDIDECGIGTAVCGANTDCNNTIGGYTCTCKDGYTQSGGLCVDFNECASPRFHDCSENGTCTNTDGSYTCACDAHFTGNGVVCADVNECQAGTSGCEAGELCVNVYGGPNSCDCAPGYARVNGEGPCVTTCGNGLRVSGEGCDDGNFVDGDGCSATCAVEEGYACYEPGGAASRCTFTCGDGLIDPPAEECDDADANTDTAPNGCRTTCRLAHCGDGIIDEGEQCDTGDLVSATAIDACRTTCVPAFCGDGVVDTGERCDPGGGTALDASICRKRTCGPDTGDGGCAVSTREGSGAGFGLVILAFALATVRRRRR